MTLLPKRLGAKSTIFLLSSVMSGFAATTQADVLNPQIGPLLFEENFNSLDSARWNMIEGDGCAINLCGWGNGELEFYRAANLTVESPSFEPATKALAFQAKREAFGTKNFTSAKITSADKIQVKYGMVEIRMSTPQVGVGLWPAAWMLGTSLASWPAKGELDIMEMGHSAQARADAGFAGADINAYTGSNAIFYASGACAPGNETCAAMTAWQTANAYVASTPLTNRFVTYRLYWTDAQLRFTVVDNGVEHDMYKRPIDITSEMTEFQAPYYFLFNLAVGGNFTDARSDGQVSAPLPGKMYIDYIRVYQLDGKGEVKVGNQTAKETGVYGVFTDNTPTTRKETLGTTSDFWIWNTTSMVNGTAPAYEGSNVLSLKYTTPGQWFGGGIASRQPHDMSNFINGTVKFRVKVPANVSFKVGVSDTYSNTNYVTFPANTTTYGLVRTGDWAQATVPVADLRGPLVALQSMSSLFSFVSVDGALPSSTFDMAFDDVIWDCGSGAACQGTASSSSVASSASSVASSKASSSISSSISSSKSSLSSQASSSLSSVKSSASSIASSASSSTVAGNQQCNWYGTRYPLCVTTTSGWGYENGQSCISASTCTSQPAPYGIVGGASSSSVATSSVKSSSSTPVSSSSSSVKSSASSMSNSSSSTAVVSSCQYIITNEWSNGFTATVRITNKGTNAINGWNVNWTYAGDNRVTSLWNATLVGSQPYNVSNLDWNSVIQPGQFVEFGFQGTKGSTAEKPVIKGSVCN